MCTFRVSHLVRTRVGRVAGFASSDHGRPIRFPLSSTRTKIYQVPVQAVHSCPHYTLSEGESQHNGMIPAGSTSWNCRGCQQVDCFSPHLCQHITSYRPGSWISPGIIRSDSTSRLVGWILAVRLARECWLSSCLPWRISDPNLTIHANEGMIWDGLIINKIRYVTSSNPHDGVRFLRDGRFRFLHATTSVDLIILKKVSVAILIVLRRTVTYLKINPSDEIGLVAGKIAARIRNIRRCRRATHRNRRNEGLSVLLGVRFANEEMSPRMFHLVRWYDYHPDQGCIA